MIQRASVIFDREEKSAAGTSALPGGTNHRQRRLSHEGEKRSCASVIYHGQEKSAAGKVTAAYGLLC